MYLQTAGLARCYFSEEINTKVDRTYGLQTLGAPGIVAVSERCTVQFALLSQPSRRGHAGSPMCLQEGREICNILEMFPWKKTRMPWGQFPGEAETLSLSGKVPSGNLNPWGECGVTWGTWFPSSEACPGSIRSPMLEVPRPPEPWLPVVWRWRTDQGSEETGAGDVGHVIDI